MRSGGVVPQCGMSGCRGLQWMSRKRVSHGDQSMAATAADESPSSSAATQIEWAPPWRSEPNAAQRGRAIAMEGASCCDRRPSFQSRVYFHDHVSDGMRSEQHWCGCCC